MSQARPPELQVLVVDDEEPALADLAYLLGQDPRVVGVHTAASGPQALRQLDDHPVDGVFCDISMPGLDGLDLARVLARFAHRPQVVFVTAHDGHAVDAFALGAVDYLMKPVRAERLAEAVRRVALARDGRAAHTGDGRAAHDPTSGDETVAVELGGTTRFVQRSQIRYVQAQGDYARLRTAEGSHLLRVSLTTLEDRWGAAGFVRIHRSTLVAVQHVDEVRVDGGRFTLRLGSDVLTVSRRHNRDLRERLLHAGRATSAAEGRARR